MDDAVGRLCGGAQAVQVVHVAAEDLGSYLAKGLGTRVRTVEPDDAIACVDEFRNMKGIDEASGTGDKILWVMG